MSARKDQTGRFIQKLDGSAYPEDTFGPRMEKKLGNPFIAQPL